MDESNVLESLNEFPFVRTELPLIKSLTQVALPLFGDALVLVTEELRPFVPLTLVFEALVMC